MNEKITIALHTRAHAERLKKLLKKEGIEVDINPVELPRKLSDMPVALDINISDIPSALRIIENLEIFSLEEPKLSKVESKPRITAKDIILGKTAKDLIMGKKTVGRRQKLTILLPVDFSEYSFMAARLAFLLAKRHGAGIVILHAFMLPSPTDNLSLSPDTPAYEPSDMDLDLTLEQTARAQMDNFAAKLRDNIKDGIIPPVKFETEILEGLPENVINDYARDHDPLLIVMGTRGSVKKERELMGSITAEVLDTCRTPVFTVPETSKTLNPQLLKEVVFFCNLDDDDITAVNRLTSLFPDSTFHITFIHIESRRDKLSIFTSDSTLKRLSRYCKSKFPSHTFSTIEMQPKDVKDFFTSGSLKKVNFIVIPNKRRLALARFFNPSLAHRLLFHTDIPMLVVPV